MRIMRIFIFFITASVFIWSGSAVPKQTTALLSETKNNLVETHNVLLNLNTSITKINNTLDAVNRPCEVPGQPCGSLADVNRTLATVRGTFGQIEVAARHENRNLTKLDSQEEQLFKDTHKILIAGAGSLNSVTTTLNSANNTLNVINDPKNGVKPLLISYTNAGNSLNNILDGKPLNDTLVNLSGMVVHFNNITGKFELVVDKISDDYLSPKPWYKKTFHYFGDAIDFGALAARHLP